MNKINLYLKTFCDRLKKCSNNERSLEQQKIFCNENLNIEDLQKSLRGSSIEKSPNYFMTGTSCKYNDHMSDMAVSACVSGQVFGDTVYGVQ